MKPTLTTRQQQVLDFIRAHQRKMQRSPTVREIGDHFGINSPNGVTCHLKALEKKRAIERDRNASCGIRVNDKGTGFPFLTEKLLKGIDR